MIAKRFSPYRILANYRRVWNYRVVSNGRTAKDLSLEIKNSLIFTTFRPAAYAGLRSVPLLYCPSPKTQ